MPADEEVLDQGTTDEGVVDGESQDDQGTPDGSSSGDEDFLVVDERTKYKTREDAVKAYQSAGQRISQLSAWEKEVGQRFKVSDPRQVAAALDEYIEMKNTAAAQGKKGVQATHSENATELTKDEQDALKWLKKVAPQAGFVPKEELEALKAKLEQLQGGVNAADEARLSHQVEQGRGQLAGLLADAKMPTDGDFSNFVEQAITNWANADQERIDRWQAGGESAKALVKEGFDWAMKQLKQVQRPATANYQEKKQSATQSRPKTLPLTAGSPAKRGSQPVKPGGITPELHKKAWEVFRSKIGGDSSEQ